MNDPDSGNPPAPPTDPPSGSQPTDSEIASLLEGKLDGAERERVLAALRADPESFAVFAEAADFLAEDAAAAGESDVAPPVTGDPVVPIGSPRRRGAAQWLGGLAAAAAVLAFFILLPVLSGPGTALVASSELLAPVLEATTPDALAALAVTTALSEPPPAFAGASTAAQRGVRYGALTVDLALASAADLTSPQASIARYILDSSTDLGLGSANAGALLRASQGESLSVDAMASLERELAGATDAAAFQAGQKLQALHVAAIARTSGDDLSELGRGAIASLDVANLQAPSSDSLREALSESPPDSERVGAHARDVLLELLL